MLNYLDNSNEWEIVFTSYAPPYLYLYIAITTMDSTEYNKVGGRPQTHTDLHRVKLKNYHRLKGIVESHEQGYGSSYSFVVMKGKGKSAKYYYFQTLAPEVIELIKSLPLLSKITVIFSIKCVPVNDKWYTNLWALFVEVPKDKERSVVPTQSEKTLFHKDKNSVLKNTFGG